jgi:threonine synthase
LSTRLSHLECARCGREHDAFVLQTRCDCGGTLLARYDLRGISIEDVLKRPADLWRWRELLPIEGEPVRVQEAETPLVLLDSLCDRWGVDVYLKDDGPLPGETFKARGASVALTRAVELGVESFVMPTAGNAGGAWAAYATEAGVPITVCMSRSAPEFNQREVKDNGGSLELVDGTIADAGGRAKEIAAETGAFLASTFNEPYRVEGKKTAWLETFAQLGRRLPATIVTPVGGGVAAIAAWKAAEEFVEAGWATGEMPRIVGVQPDDCAPIARAFRAGTNDVEAWPQEPKTIAAGLRVPSPSEGYLVLDRVRASAGSMEIVGDEEMRRWIDRLRADEGIWVCPEGASAVAAADALARTERLEGPVVLYNTGAGSKYESLLDA